MCAASAFPQSFEHEADRLLDQSFPWEAPISKDETAVLSMQFHPSFAPPSRLEIRFARDKTVATYANVNPSTIQVPIARWMNEVRLELEDRLAASLHP